MSKDDLTRGERMIKFIETYCVVPEGDHVGKPVKLADFQKKFILEIYDNPHGTDTAILSIARKNAKTGTIAFLVLGHLVGPEAKRNSRIVSGARSREQASEVYNLASKCVMQSPQLRKIIRDVPSSKKLIGLPMNVEYQATSAEGKTAHGKSPIVAILDEVGQVKGPRDEFIDAITTAQGAYEDPLLIYISTQAANDGDLFSILIDDALEKKPPKTVCHVYAADEEADLLDEEQWKKANPAYGLFRSKKDMKKQAEKASRIKSFENTFRNLNLNQRISSASPFISKSTWSDCGGTPPRMEGFQLWGGLDLSMKTDLTSLVLVGVDEDNELCVWPFFWTPEEGLLDRADRDREPYDIWVDQGYLLTTPGHTVAYEHVISDIIDVVGNENELMCIGFDRYKMPVFQRECDHLGVELPVIEHGQGFKDMSVSIDKLEEYLLNSRMKHGMHPVLTMCSRNAKVKTDPAEGRKFDKMHSNGRIDGIVALTMAVGTMDKSIESLPSCPWDDENYRLQA